MGAFDVIASSNLSTEQARKLVQDCFADLVAEAEGWGGFVPQSDQPDLEVFEQVCLSNERIVGLREQLDTCKYDGSVIAEGRAAAKRQGLALDAFDPVVRLNVLSGVARALTEQQKLFQLRIEDRLSRFAPADPLFRPDQMNLAAQTTAIALPSEQKGVAVAAAIVRYLEAGKKQWVRKTYQARVWQLRFFEEHVGAALPLTAVTVDHIRTFRDAVRTLHKMHGKRKGTFAQRQTDNIDHQISDKTASIIFEPVKAFFRWAWSVDGLISTNPAENVRIAATKKVKGQKSRRPFTASELKVLFSAPIFTGCRSIHRRYEPGDKIIKDAKFWIPILGFYTGARLGELVQLHVRDVHLDGPIPHLSINEDNSEAGDDEFKHVKSEAGIRIVPLHPDVMALGFGAFVAKWSKKAGKGGVRLFDQFSYGSDGQASTVASKWFARFMDSVGLTDRALVFHSFRHNAEDAFRDALVPQYVIDRIIGHSDSATSSSYGNGISLETAEQAVKMMKLIYRLRF